MLNKLIKKLTCVLPFVLAAHVYAGDHDACGVYVDIINNSPYTFDATGIGSRGNYNWQDSGSFNSHNQIAPHSKTHLFTTPSFDTNSIGGWGKWKERSYQFFDLVQDNTNNNKTTFELYILDGTQDDDATKNMRLTNKNTGNYIDTNAILSDDGYIVGDNYHPGCYDNIVKPRFTIIIASNGQVNDQETLAGNY